MLLFWLRNGCDKMWLSVDSDLISHDLPWSPMVSHISHDLGRLADLGSIQVISTDCQ